MISTKTDQIDFLLDGSEVTIGRDLSSIVHLSGIGISRYHASITLSQKHPVLHDLESTFGVRVNSVLLKGSVELNDGDLLTIGTHAFVVSLNNTMLSLCCSSAITDEIRIKAPGGDQGLRIGRDCENEISLSHPMVSRLHATVSYGTSDRLTIHDHKSTNGTFVNGYRVSDCGLYDGDIIQIGPCRLLIDQGKVIRFDDKNRIRIEVCGVSVKRDGAVLLNNVNISIPPGEFVVILGPSGAGKSTLIDALTGKIKPSSGEVYANGLPLQKFLNAFASSIGYVSQDTVLYKELTVGEIFKEQSLLRLPHDATDQERTSRVNEVIDLLDLSKVVLCRVGHLSGGEARRVLLGVELLSSPAIIFLDEPLSGLDPGLVRRFMLLFRKISDQGHTLILITHNLDQLELCDHVIFLNRGESVFQGSPSELGSVFNTTSIAEIYRNGMDRRRIAHIHGMRPRAPPQRSHFLRHSFCVLRRARNAGHIGAGCRKLTGDGSADAAPGASHQGDLAR
jgi:ABC-type multidrug transport system ATPase subunit/pSer/pThr/pTyr-binding forkhead associated (FHA) protein